MKITLYRHKGRRDLIGRGKEKKGVKKEKLWAEKAGGITNRGESEKGWMTEGAGEVKNRRGDGGWRVERRTERRRVKQSEW